MAQGSGGSSLHLHPPCSGSGTVAAVWVTQRCICGLPGAARYKGRSGALLLRSCFNCFSHCCTRSRTSAAPLALNVVLCHFLSWRHGGEGMLGECEVARHVVLTVGKQREMGAALTPGSSSSFYYI